MMFVNAKQGQTVHRSEATDNEDGQIDMKDRQKERQKFVIKIIMEYNEYRKLTSNHLTRNKNSVLIKQISLFDAALVIK